MKKILLSILTVTVTGCATIPREEISLSSNDDQISILVKRSGCELVGIEVKNNGTSEATVRGDINILDAQSNTVSTVKFRCDTVYPGGTAMCRGSQNYNDKLLYQMPGLYCAGYSSYEATIKK